MSGEIERIIKDCRSPVILIGDNNKKFIKNQENFLEMFCMAGWVEGMER